MHTYTELYASLDHQHQKDVRWFARHWLTVMVGLSWVFTLWLLWLNPDDWLVLLGVGMGLTVIFSAVVFMMWLMYMAWAGSFNPLRQANRFTAHFLLAEPSLSSTQRGLTKTDIEQLQKIAAIEQGAADWRGNFINLIIVGVLFGTVAFLLNPLPEGLSQWRDSAQETSTTPVTINSPLTDFTLPPALVGGANIVSFIVVGILFLLLLKRLADYFNDFIAAEAGNRLIQFACVEALALLEREGLSDQNRRTMADKRRIARLLGFRLRRSYIHTLRTPFFEDDEQRAYFLDEVKRPSFSPRLWFHNWNERFFMQGRMRMAESQKMRRPVMNHWARK